MSSAVFLILAAVAFVASCGSSAAAAEDALAPGLSPSARILGGHRANIQTYPYQVSVRHKNKHVCGGSILSASIVLTAAQCFEKPLNAADYGVQYGLTYIGEGSEHVIAASLVLRHKNFDSKTRDNNVALIYLVAQIPFGESAQPIQLASANPKVGTTAHISGWGALKSNKPDAVSRGLRYAEVTIVKKALCTREFAAVGEKFAKEGMFCAGVVSGSGNRDAACATDAGGALVADGQLYGIIAGGLGCDSDRVNFYGLYASVAKLSSWIEFYANLDY